MLPPVMFFDLDDTIIAFDPISLPLWQELSAAYCRAHLRYQATQIFVAIRHAAAWYWSDAERHRMGRLHIVAARRTIVKSAFQEVGIMDDVGASALADEFSVKRTERLTLYIGARETLAELRRRGVRLALLTNGDSEGQNYKIDRFGLRGYFEKIFIEEEIGMGKPEEYVYQLALAQMHIAPQEVWMIGDNLENDIAAPQAQGIKGIWNDFRGKGLPATSYIVPDQIINSIVELVVTL
jgi:putative hydrolase of the HAD superfamily